MFDERKKIFQIRNRSTHSFKVKQIFLKLKYFTNVISNFFLVILIIIIGVVSTDAPFYQVVQSL